VIFPKLECSGWLSGSKSVIEDEDIEEVRPELETQPFGTDREVRAKSRYWRAFNGMLPAGTSNKIPQRRLT
jgi:hypothetical protein